MTFRIVLSVTGKTYESRTLETDWPILQQALSDAPADLQKFVQEACGGELLQQLVSLIQHEREAEHFSEAPALQRAAQVLPTTCCTPGPTWAGPWFEELKRLVPTGNNWAHMIGQSVSHYRIVIKLGASGMGEVYRAEDPNLHRSTVIRIAANVRGCT